MLVICAILLVLPKAEAIKFSAEGVSVPDGVLRVDEPTELGCKYIMWRQESLASVTWSIKYSGVKTDFFVYKPFNKEVKPGMSMLSVDATNSEDKMVNMRLTDGGEDEVVICCDVKVLRDDGYGSMTTKHKEKCSAPIRVEDQSRSRHNLVSISADVPETGSVGETVPIVCNARNLDLYHTLRLMVNGRTLQERREQTVQYSLPLHQTHFTRSSGRYGQEEAVVSCLVKDQRGLTIANDTRLIRKEESERLAPMQSWDQARMGNSRDGRDFHTAQPGDQSTAAPHHSYLILEETYNGGSRLLGRISGRVLEGIPSPSRTGDNIVETSLAPVEVLDVLGFSGYRVVGVAPHNNKMAWTLERQHSELRREL